MAVQYTSDLTIQQVTEDAGFAARFYSGFGFRNSTGAAIVVNIYDGEDTGGDLLDSVAVPANSSQHALYSDPLPVASGTVFVDWTTGIVGNVRIIA